MALRGVEQQIAGDAKDLTGMHAGRRDHVQSRHHLACNLVGAGDPAVGVQGEQAIGFAAQRVARPVQAQQQPVCLAAQQSVFDSLRGLTRQVLEFRALDGFNAGQIQHADAAAVGAEQRRTGATVDRGVGKEMLTPVQPDRLQFGQRGANGRGADAALGQVGADAGDVVGAAVGAVNGAAGVDDDPVGVGEDGKVTGVGDGMAELQQDRLCRLHQLLVRFGGAAHLLFRDAVKHNPFLRPQAQAQAALPRLLNPVRDGADWQQRVLLQHGAARLGDAVQPRRRVVGFDGKAGIFHVQGDSRTQRTMACLVSN